MTRALQKLIHAGCRELGIDEDTRRDLQLQVTGKPSLAAMTEPEMEQVVAALRARGFRPSPGAAPRRKAAERGDVRFAHVLWGKLFRAGAVDKAGAAGLNAFRGAGLPAPTTFRAKVGITSIPSARCAASARRTPVACWTGASGTMSPITKGPCGDHQSD